MRRVTNAVELEVMKENALVALVASGVPRDLIDATGLTASEASFPVKADERREFECLVQAWPYRAPTEKRRGLSGASMVLHLMGVPEEVRWEIWKAAIPTLAGKPSEIHTKTERAWHLVWPEVDPREMLPRHRGKALAVGKAVGVTNTRSVMEMQVVAWEMKRRFPEEDLREWSWLAAKWTVDRNEGFYLCLSGERHLAAPEKGTERDGTDCVQWVESSL